ncbi:MAG: ABC transporter permease [Burkholderiales bacterium]|nr:ABC transporter permease [Anaerolineae bacterium]
MIRHLILRIVQSFGLLLGVLALVFCMVRLTGDPASLMLSREATDEQRAEFRERYGFNDPIPVQLAAYLGNLVRGELGTSLSLGIPNATLIGQRLPATFELAVTSLLLAVGVGVPLGVISGLMPRSFFDYVARGLGLLGQTIPSFWLAMILILVFAVQLRLLPSFGRDGLRSLILPSIALALGSMGQLVRLTRSSVLEVRSENYVRTARSKGLSSQQIAWRHIIPNTAIPLVSVIGVHFTYLLGGSIYIEAIFSWPGLGSLLNNAINDTDFPLIQAITIFIALFAIGMNVITDMLYGLLDPRIRQR